MCHYVTDPIHGKGRHRRGKMDQEWQVRHPDAVHKQQRLCGTLCGLWLGRTPSWTVQAIPSGLHGVRGFRASQRRADRNSYYKRTPWRAENANRVLK